MSATQPLPSRSSPCIRPNQPEILPVVQKWKDVPKSNNQLCIFEMLRSRQGMKWAAPSAIYKFMPPPPPPPPPWLLLRPLHISLPWWWKHCKSAKLPLPLLFNSLFWTRSIPRSLSMHYWLRPIKSGQFRFANFAPRLKWKCHFHFLIHWFFF